jgi:micrococcal nuclease
MRRAILLALVAAVAATTFVVGREDGAAPAEPRVGRVVGVTDGDTIRVALGAGVERVRYIGVDTPESRRPGTPMQCFARRAAEANARLVSGRRVRLVLDVEQRDRYGRMLAYVYRAGDGRFVNAALVRDGYARTLTVPPNVRFADRFARLAADARRSGRGLWSACRFE